MTPTDGFDLVERGSDEGVAPFTEIGIRLNISGEYFRITLRSSHPRVYMLESEFLVPL